MLIEGLKLTSLGMGVVFLFLGLLVMVIKLSSRLLRSYTDKEEAASFSAPVKKLPRRPAAVEEQKRVIAVITAAIAMHRAVTTSSTRASAHTAVDSPALSQPNQKKSISYQTGLSRKPTGPCQSHLMFHDHSVFQGFRQIKKR